MTTKPRWGRVLAPILLALVVAGAWWACTVLEAVPHTVLPAPSRVASRLAIEFSSGRILDPLLVTLAESLAGCLVAVAIAIPVAWGIAHSRIAAAALSPYLAASQAVPAVAIAPVLVIWVGYGALPVIVLCCVMVVFPMILTTVLGLRRIDPEVLDAARVDGADGFRLATSIEWPLALPATMTGIRNGVTLSITGSVVGELVMGGSGMGQRLAIQAQSSDTTGMLATLIVLCALAIAIYLSMTGLEWLIDPLASRRRWRVFCDRRSTHGETDPSHVTGFGGNDDAASRVQQRRAHDGHEFESVTDDGGDRGRPDLRSEHPIRALVRR